MNQLIPVGQEWLDIKNMSSILVKSQFLPKSVDTAEKACAIMLMGRELGVGPMEAFSKISVIQGKPTVGAELQKAMVHKKLPAAKFYLKSSDEKQCTYAAARPGDPEADFQFTMKDAEAMGLVNKDNWKKQPKTMLRWRCISQVCRTVFPDCLSGVSYTPEELGAVVDDEGEVIDIPAEPTSIKQIHAEAKAEQTGKKREVLLKEIMAAMKELGDIGFKEGEIFAQLNIKQYADLNKEDEKGLESALAALTQLALR